MDCQTEWRSWAVIIRRMQTLRHAHFLARFVLVWFALAIGVAIASPIVNPQAIELICSGSGGAMKLLVKSDDGARNCPATRWTAPCVPRPARRRP